MNDKDLAELLSNDNVRLEVLEDIYALMAGYKTTPVDINEFIDNDEFLGRYFGGEFRPYWRRVFNDIYPSPIYSPYWLVNFRGALGTGKTSSMCVGMAYDLYKLLCLSDPQKTYGLIASTTLVFAIYNTTLSLSQDVVWGKLSQMFFASPFFNKLADIFRVKRKHETLFPHSIDFNLGSRISHSRGKAIYEAAIDEANFEIVEGQVYDTFSSLVRRIESRFLMPGGAVPGKIWVVSSESDKFSTINRIVDGYKNDPGVYTDQAALWEVLTHKNSVPLYSGKKFQVYIGSEIRQAAVITNDLSQLVTTEPERIIDVPIELKSSFEFDVNASLRDLAGVSTVSSMKFFRNKQILKAAMQIAPSLFPDTFHLDFNDNLDSIIAKCRIPQYFKNPLYPKHPRYIHVDIGVSQDRLGIASSLIQSFTERTTRDPHTLQEVKEQVPTVMTEWAFGIEAKAGQQIPLFKVRMFLMMIAKLGIRISKITFDSYQSTDFIQLLQSVGFSSEILSMDKSTAPYMVTRTLITEGRSIITTNEVLSRELSELEMDSKGIKIDHPKKNRDNTKGSKDIADAVAGSIYSAIINQGETRELQFIHASRLPETNHNEAIKKLFWPSN